MPLVLAIDQGTTGTTCLALDEAGSLRGRAYSEFAQHFPEPGWVEHDAEEIWRVTLRVAREALERAGEGPGADRSLAAIGITNQRETVVLWDRSTGRPVHRAIVWQDRRTAAECRAWREAGRDEWLRERTGLVFDPYFSATKLAWLLNHVPGARDRAERGELAAGTVDSWILWQLTGGRVHATEPTNASRTLLFNIASLGWDAELLSFFRIPAPLLPEVKPSSGIFGTTDPSLFGSEVPIAGIAGDQQAALFGQGAWHPGTAKNTYGTGAFLLLNTGERLVISKHGLLGTVACGPGGEPVYALEGSIFIAGAAVQWLRDGLRIVRAAEETEALAASLAGNDGVYFVPAFVGLGAPHWQPDVRGTLVGLTRGTTRAHIARAALESMAYSTLDALEAMQKDSGVAASELGIDGGASQNNWLAQFQADILGLPVRRPALVETTALGAAGLAGLGVGLWPDADSFLSARPEPATFAPSMGADVRDELIAGWRRALAAAHVAAGISDD